MGKIRVLIVEDSAVVRHLLEQVIRDDARLEVAASVATAEEAIRLLPTLRPNIISMDINLPGMDGLEATHRIMAENPTPILIVSSSVSADDARTSLDALRAGALSVAEKPVGPGHPEFAAAARQIVNKLALMSEVSVVRQRAGRQWRSTPPSEEAKNGTAAAVAPAPLSRPLQNDASIGGSATPRFLAVVASTGGPQALVRVFNDLGSGFPLPVLLVQHITAAFVESFASWLDGVVPFTVTIASDRQRPLPGHIYLAPADRHLLLGRDPTGAFWLRLDNGPMLSGQRPSGTRLFESLALTCGPASLGVLLTGMGDDGADGLVALRKAGGYTIAEDKSTAVVYGMPAAAVQRGGVIETVPLGTVAARIRVRLNRAATETTTAEEGSDDGSQ